MDRNRVTMQIIQQTHRQAQTTSQLIAAARLPRSGAHQKKQARDTWTAEPVEGTFDGGSFDTNSFDSKSLSISMPAVILQAAVTLKHEKVEEGVIITALIEPWVAIIKELLRDPSLRANFARMPRQLEELVAASYDIRGWKVTLTPRSGDGGKDVIAEDEDMKIVIFDQVKAYSPGHLVTHDDVGAAQSLLLNPSVNKVYVTTTSDFQPTIRSAPRFEPYVPKRLELRNGDDLIEWFHRASKHKGLI